MKNEKLSKNILSFCNPGADSLGVKIKPTQVFPPRMNRLFSAQE